MNMLDQTPEATPKPKRKYVRRKRAVSVPTVQPDKPAVSFVGITAEKCCAACNLHGCVISGRPYCAHPYKGGLQGADNSNQEAIARLSAAKKAIGKAKIRVVSDA